MIEIQLKEININKPFIGKVNCVNNGNIKVVNKTNDVININENIEGITEGDIVLIEPSGRCCLLYCVNSFSNSFIVTNRCNAKCIMCPQPYAKTNSNELSLSLEVVNLISDEPSIIGITGGEPTIDRKGLLKLISSIVNKFNNTKIQLLTNGILLNNYEYTSELALISKGRLSAAVPLYSDIDTIHDSIMGLRGSFWKTIEGINNLERAGVYIELRNVLMNNNIDRLSEWAKFIYRIIPFVGHVAIMGLEPMGRAKSNIDFLYVNHDSIGKTLADTIKTFIRVGIKPFIYNYPLCHLPQSLWQYSEKSISEWKRSYLHQCGDCTQKENCGGFFSSWGIIKDYKIKPITNE